MATSFSRLRRAQIRALSVNNKVTERGISARKLSNGDVRWSVNIMVDGKRIHRVVGLESEGVTRSQAEQFIEKTRSAARENRLSLPKGRKLSLTFDTAADIYLSKLREISGKDYVNNEQHLRLHLKPYFGAMRFDRISAFTIQKFRSECRRSGLKDPTINRILATFRRMGRKLLEWQVIGAGLPPVKLERERNERTYVITNDEETELLAAALQDPHPYVWLFVKLGIATALRHGEILRCRFDRFNPARRRLAVVVKGGKWRQQPLTRSITEIIARERSMAEDQNGWIFPSKTSQSGHIPHLSAAFARCVRRAKLDPTITPHTMRHTAITRLALSGADIKTIQEFSGHESIQMVLRYAHAQDRAIDEALDRLELTAAQPKKPRTWTHKTATPDGLKQV